ncbi:hypothetical protein GGX14DRAFT_535918 [Mycena pura]|uniref:MYND-type domain-containing protein n=1 Tax=Mycena pura TaxID=153505 RepID=A0AAD6Y613_9AGAR|nr:hypothetical protein GGX14DRAFT_535918 [Mycena pura]
MNKRHGAEAVHGLGGGTVSTKSQKNLEKAEELCRKNRPSDAVPPLLRAIKDEQNLDAWIQMAFMCDRNKAVEILEMAESTGRMLMQTTLGSDAFADDGPHVGKFWDILAARPYMRVLQAQVRMYFETKNYTRSAETIIEMMRLCPGDNMGQRDWLGSLLLRLHRDADALHFAQVWINASEGGGMPPLRGGTTFRAPHRDVFSGEREKALSDPVWGPAVHLHNAALAAFRLRGPCPQATQYLRMAARANPHVLVKILGRRSRPDALNMDARAINGPEAAHDYRFLTQDLWTAPQAWAWITGDETVNNELLKICSRPECPALESQATQFKRCAACHQAIYCGKACQKGDWMRHKRECQEHRALKKTIRDFQANNPNTTSIPIYAADLANGTPVVYDGTSFL